MSMRSIAVAGPSRLPAWTAPLAAKAFSPPTVHRRNFTWPSPVDDPSRGTLLLRVSAPYRIPSILHVFAIMRAVEREYGPVAALDAPMDPSSRLYGFSVTFTLYTPVPLDGVDRLEVPQPSISPESNVYGGASFEDIEALLGGSLVPGSASGLRPMNDSGVNARDDAPTIPCRVERPNRDWMSKYVPQLKPVIPKGVGRQVAELAWKRKEETDIAFLLERIGDGYHGGFKGLAEEFANLRRTPDEQYGQEMAVPEEVALGEDGHILTTEELERLKGDRASQAVSEEPQNAEVEELRGWKPATGKQMAYATPPPMGLHMPKLPRASPSSPPTFVVPSIKTTSSPPISRSNAQVPAAPNKWTTPGNPHLTEQMRNALEVARKRIAAAERDEALSREQKQPKQPGKGPRGRAKWQAATTSKLQPATPIDPEEARAELHASLRARDSEEAYEDMRQGNGAAKWYKELTRRVAEERTPHRQSQSQPQPQPQPQSQPSSGKRTKKVEKKA